MAREVQSTYTSCAELDGKLRSQENDYIALTATVVKVYDTRKVGDVFFRNIFVADTPDAQGKLKISLKSRERKYLDNIKIGNRYIFKGFLNIDKETGVLSIGGAYATRVKSDIASTTNRDNYNPRSYIVGMMFNKGMDSFAPTPFLNGDWEANDAELGARMDCVRRCITDERVDALLAKANPIQKKSEPEEETTKSDDPFRDQEE